MDYILDGLNAGQQAAVSSSASVLQVLAPPGSGKTKTLTARVAYLLCHHRYRPQDVICCTFTVKASREMRERIGKLLGNRTESSLVLGTFHSICRRYLVKYGNLIGLGRGFGIADSSDSLAIIRRIIKRFGLSIQANSARSRISHQKAHGVSPSELATRVKTRNSKLVEQQELVQVYYAYEAALAASSLLDYDDLLLRCADLLREYPECVSNVQAVLVDEFQDTNRIQYELMNLFASRNQRITVVGDPDQSIYGFRSAEIKNLARMRQLYKNTSVVLLENNYRSSGSILSSAQDVIEQDVSRPTKRLQPTHCIGTMPVLRKLPTAEAEAQWIVFEIKRCIAMTGGILGYSDFAVLLRSAALSRHIESEMGKNGVPYKMIGGSRFFDRAEVKLLLDYLRVVSHTGNNDSLLRVINVPPRRIGEESIKLLLSGAEEAKISLWDFVKDVAQGRRSTKRMLPTQTSHGISAFVNLVQAGRQKLLGWKDESAPKNLLQLFVDKLSIQEYLRRTYQLDESNRWANVLELLNQAADVASDVKMKQDDSLPEINGLVQQETHPGEDALSQFLANVALATDTVSQVSEQQQNSVVISTIHAAKGLEWPVVFIPAVYDGIIPHSRAEDSDEERRLLYVAMTRAQALLYLSFPLESRNGFETSKTSRTLFLPDNIVASRFRPVGPHLNEGTVYQIADILRRERPSMDMMLKGLRDIPSVYDDRWTADGAGLTDTIIRWDNEQNAGNEEPYPKRRRHGQASFNLATHTLHTIQSPADLSVPANISLGFSTARECISRGRHQLRGPDAVNNTVNKKSGLSPGDIAEFFSQASSRAQSRSRLSSADNRRRSTSSDPKKKIHQDPKIGPDASQDKLLSKLTVYRPQTQRRPSRPTLEETRPSSYTWLSSSPACAEQLDMQDCCDGLGASNAKENHEEKSPSEIKGLASDIQQATTFHKTTMSILQRPVSQTGRRTLGIRRTMGNGWEERMNKERNRNP